LNGDYEGFYLLGAIPSYRFQISPIHNLKPLTLVVFKFCFRADSFGRNGLKSSC